MEKYKQVKTDDGWKRTEEKEWWLDAYNKVEMSEV